jgi:hypothetical protein
MNTKRIYPILIVIGILLAFTPQIGSASFSRWTEPENLSDWHPAFSEPWLVQGKEGTKAIFWIHYDINPNMDSVQARVRHPSSGWGEVESVFGPVEEYPVYPKFAAAPDGTFWVLWAMEDKNQTGDNIRVVAASWTANEPWQTESLSDYETAVRDIDLTVGPDGHIAATWVACASTAGEHEGPCDVRLRRRNPGMTHWESSDSVDAAVTGIIDGRSLVGPQGLVVTIWGEYSQKANGEWMVMSTSFDPGTKTWDFPPKDISDGGFLPGVNHFLSEPTMGADGTVIAGWYKRESLTSNKSKLLCVTRQGASGKWNLPKSLSYYQFPSLENTLHFALGQNGTAVPAWVARRGSISEYILYVNQRDPGSTWLSDPIKVSNWIDRINLAPPQVWPDGSSLLIWTAVDNRRPPSESDTVFWSARSPKGAWGDLGGGQLGGWLSEIFSISLAAGENGSVTTVWGIKDTSQPAGQYAGALAASWTPGKGDIPVFTLTSGYHSIYLDEDGVAVSPDGSSRAAAWVARKYINNPNPTAVEGVFYTHWFNAAYLPMVVK